MFYLHSPPDELPLYVELGTLDCLPCEATGGIFLVPLDTEPTLLLVELCPVLIDCTALITNV